MIKIKSPKEKYKAGAEQTRISHKMRDSNRRHGGMSIML